MEVKTEDIAYKKVTATDHKGDRLILTGPANHGRVRIIANKPVEFTIEELDALLNATTDELFD